jgi:hypothetical protein
MLWPLLYGSSIMGISYIVLHYKRSTWPYILRQLNPVHKLTYHVSKIQLSIVLSSMLKRASSRATDLRILPTIHFLNLVICILLRALDQIQGFPSNTTLFQ